MLRLEEELCSFLETTGASSEAEIWVSDFISETSKRLAVYLQRASLAMNLSAQSLITPMDTLPHNMSCCEYNCRAVRLSRVLLTSGERIESERAGGLSSEIGVRMSKGTVVAAMSGGVDSAVTAALLKQEGYEVIGITLQIWQEHAEQGKYGGCCSLGAVEDARRAAAKIGIPHYVLNFRDYFADRVIKRFVDEYSKGRTPNPCVECNRSVKFDELLRHAEDLGADYLATGHYARIRYNESTGRYELLRARD